MPSMNVSLTPELMQLVQSKVETGLYNNASEVIRDAIRQLDTNEKLLFKLKTAHLKQALAPGLQQARSGESAPYSIDSLIKSLNSPD